MFIEREEPLTQLVGLAAGLDQGRGAVALVCGEAGIGKSALMDALRDRVADTHTLMIGGCEALFTPRALGPIHDMARQLSRSTSQLLTDGAHSSTLFASILDDLNDARRPIVMIVEDTHWADHATLDFLKFLGRRIAVLPVILVMTYRDDEIDQKHPLTQVIGDLPPGHTHRIKLEPLSDAGVTALAAAMDKEDIAADLASISGGNPFFVTELLASGSHDNDVIPASVKDAVSARLNRLGKDERVFLELLSVVPNSVPREILAPLFGDAGVGLSLEAIDHGVLVRTDADALRFRHELTRLAVQSRISAPQRKAYHADVLAAFEADDVDANYDQLVQHAAGAMNAEKVLKYAPLAAKKAAILGAHREAAAHLAVAMRFIDDAEPALAAQLYEWWAYESYITRSIDDDVIKARRHAITLWRALGRMEKVGENLRWLSRMHWYRGEAVDATRISEEAVKTLEETPASRERAMAYSLRSQLHMLNDQMPEAIDWGMRALELADRFNDVEVRIHALNNVGTAKVFRDNRDGIAELEESLALAKDHGFHEEAARVYTNLSEYAVDFRQFELAERVLSDGIAFETQHDLDMWKPYLLGRLAQLRLLQGRLRDAETIAEGVWNTDQLALLVKLPALSVLARAKMRLGAEDKMKWLSSAFENAMATDELQNVVPIRIAHIESAWLDNAPDRAFEHFDCLFALGAKSMHDWRVGETAIWAQRFGLKAPAAFLEDLPPPYHAEANGDHEGAAKAWAEIGAPYDQAMALAHGAADGSADLLIEAQKIFNAIDAAAPTSEVRRKASDLGVASELPRRRRGPYKAARNHPLGLTQREQAVLKLLAVGAQNAEIAKQLSRSTRTIEHHVSSILTKLNVSNRMEAMLRVRSEPWLVPDDE